VIIGLVAAGGVLFLALAAGVVYVFVSKAKPEPTAVATAPEPEVQPLNTPIRPLGPETPPPPPPRPAAKPAGPAKETSVAAVKASTVYVRCTHARGQMSSGSGFFAGRPGLVVTNAHVIGQMPRDIRPGQRMPPVQKIEVFVHSGEANEKAIVARVFGFDRNSDLALLAVEGPDLPPPLEFGSAAGLTETDEVLIFGYPFGEMLGKNISVNRSTVSSLRREGGELAVVQLSGGMNPGNSGGPVTNRAGQVIGVSVAKLKGADGIDFAIPAERAAAFVRKQIDSGGNGPGEVAGNAPIGPPPAFPPPPPGPPNGRPGAPDPLAPTRTAPGGGPKPARVLTGDKPQMLGFGIGPEFRELAPEGGVLIGLELRLREDFGKYLVRQARPIYQVGDKEVMGEQRGATDGPTVTLKAKPGYAVGALIAKHGLAIDGLSLVFMRIKGKRVDPADSYESDWAGSSPPEMQASRLEGGGQPAVGLIGRADDKNLIAIATVFRGQEDAVGVFPPAGMRHTPIFGGGPEEFQDVAPAGGLLVGFHFGLGKFFDNDVIKGVRPVYRIGDKERLGRPFGGEFTRLKKVMAKPGYAVGAISMRTGLGLDGVSVTFMRINGDRLDPSDSYESEYVGGPGGGGPHKVGGDGSPAVGVIGRRNEKEVGGMGLVLKK
jgi:S1-C subfamily serine protease